MGFSAIGNGLSSWSLIGFCSAISVKLLRCGSLFEFRTWKPVELVEVNGYLRVLIGASTASIRSAWILFHRRILRSNFSLVFSGNEVVWRVNEELLIGFFGPMGSGIETDDDDDELRILPCRTIFTGCCSLNVGWFIWICVRLINGDGSYELSNASSLSIEGFDSYCI